MPLKLSYKSRAILIWMVLFLGLELLQTIHSFFAIEKSLNQRIKITHTRAGPKLTKLANH